MKLHLNFINEKKYFIYGFLLTLNLLSIAYFIYHLIKYGVLPAPFVTDHNNFFMDLFYPMQHALIGDAYDVYQSVYSPLVFIFLKVLHFISGSPEILSDPFLLRSKSFLSVFIFLFTTTILTFLSIKLPLWRKIPQVEKIFIFIIFLTSNIYLFTIERANIILFAPFLLSLILSSNIKNINYKKSIPIGILINIKSYFIFLLFPFFLKRRWKLLMITLFVSILIFTVFGFLYNQNFFLFFKNNFIFLNYPYLINPKEVLCLPSSLSGIIYVLEKNYEAQWVSNSFLDFLNLKFLILTFKLFFYSILFFCFFSIIRNRDFINYNQFFTFILLFLINLNFSFGGYTMIFYISIIPILYEMKHKFLYLFLLCLIFAPIDITFYRILYYFTDYSNLFSPSFGDDPYKLTFGIFRPIFNLMLIFTYCFEIYRKKF